MRPSHWARTPLRDDPRSQTAPVIDPALPPGRQRLLRQRASGFGVGNPNRLMGLLILAGLCGALFIATVVNPDTALSFFYFTLIALIPIAAFSVRKESGGWSSHPRSQKDLVQWFDLNDSCRGLLLRAQCAIGDVLTSQVCDGELAGHCPDERALRRHEWEIATALRDISRLQSEIDTSRAPGPLTTAVLKSHEEALKRARDSTTSRITALEYYAAQVRAAELARQDWQHAQKLSGLNDEYLDLLARTAGDEHAVTELTDLAAQAQAAAQALRESLRQAALAAEPLALPPDTTAAG